MGNQRASKKITENRQFSPSIFNFNFRFSISTFDFQISRSIFNFHLPTFDFQDPPSQFSIFTLSCFFASSRLGGNREAKSIEGESAPKPLTAPFLFLQLILIRSILGAMDPESVIPGGSLVDSRCGSRLFVIFISLGTRRAKCKKPMPAKLSYEFASKVQAATCIFACICVLLHYLFLFFQKCARRPRWEAHLCKTILSKVPSKMLVLNNFWVQ